MNIDKERELFEAWAKTEEAHFSFGLTKLDFMIWQARSSLLPTVEQIDDLLKTLKDCCGVPLDMALIDERRAIAQAISDLLEHIELGAKI